MCEWSIDYWDFSWSFLFINWVKPAYNPLLLQASMVVCLTWSEGHWTAFNKHKLLLKASHSGKLTANVNNSLFTFDEIGIIIHFFCKLFLFCCIFLLFLFCCCNYFKKLYKSVRIKMYTASSTSSFTLGVQIY